jgi:hypothetical protein
MLELEFIPTNQNEDSTFVQMNENTYDEIKDIFDFMENEFESTDFEKYIICDGDSVLDIKHLN